MKLAVKRALLVTAALVAAVAVFALGGLPDRQHRLSLPASDGSVAGAFHVHTNRSDGRSSPDVIAAAAARAGLQFVVFTDHGDATRPPDPPTYRSGVLCLDGVEISTDGGHYIALDLPAAPYPLAGAPRDVAEDVERLGGFGVVAHPDSPKPELRWDAWQAPFGGLEILNLDTSWRLRVAESGAGAWLGLGHAVLTYPFRDAETLASLVTLTTGIETRYAAIAETRRVVALAGSDAHAKLQLTDDDPGYSGWSLPIPGYETVFRALSIRVRPDRPLDGDAARDGRSILDAIRAGRAYVVVDGLASPPFFEFTARRGEEAARQGGELSIGRPVTLTVDSNAPAGFVTEIWRGNRLLASGEGQTLTTTDDPGGPAAYRAQIRAPLRAGEGAMWIFSNAIYVGTNHEASREPGHGRPGPSTSLPLMQPGEASGWATEAEPSSRAEVRLAGEGSSLEFEYALGGGEPRSQFAALVVAIDGGVSPYDRLSFRARAARPMRLSVQARAGVSADGDDRWQRSVYVDEVEREYSVFFDDMSPVGETTTPRPRLDAVRSLMFVVELTSNTPGSSGRVLIASPALER